MKFRPACERLMNDVKYADKTKAWIGSDLDGTLAKYDGWKGWQHIGEPIPEMVERLKGYMARGLTVKIWTARASKVSLAKNNLQFEQMEKVIQDWTEKVFGKRLEVVTEKDCNMLFCFDDSVVQVDPNTGKIIGSEIMVDLGDDDDYNHPIKDYDSCDVNNQCNWNSIPLDSVFYNDLAEGLTKGGFDSVKSLEVVAGSCTMAVEASTQSNISRITLTTCEGNCINEPSVAWVKVEIYVALGSNMLFFKLDNLSFKSLGKWLAARIINTQSWTQVTK